MYFPSPEGAGLVVVVVVFVGSLFYLRCRIDVVALLQNKNSCSSLIRLLLLLLLLLLS